MSLTTLATIKTQLGISGSSEDATLKHWLRVSSALVRGYCGRYFGGFISGYTVANPTVVESIGHGMETGDIIVAAGSGPGTSIDGEQTITRVDDDTFTVPVNVAVAGTRGTYTRKLTEFYMGTGQRELLLRERPVQSIASVNFDQGGYFGDATDAFASETLLAAGSDYVLYRDKTIGGASIGSSGILLRIGSDWPATLAIPGGHLTGFERPSLGNVKVTYTAGFARIPWDLQDAVIQLVAQKRSGEMSDGLGAYLSRTTDYASYTRMTAEESRMQLGSLAHTLRRYSGQVEVW